MEKVETFQISNANFSNFYSHFSKSSAPRIGAAILRHGTVTLDYKSGWFYYTPYAETPSIEAFKTFGFDVAVKDNAYVAKYVLKGSETDKGGLRSGYKILMVDDMATTQIS